MRIQPKNWGEFQHYKDREPPWIKLHRKLLDNYEFHCLPIASKALAPLLWLLASEYEDGIIDGSEDKIAFRVRMTTKEFNNAVQPLISSGFFAMYQDASNMEQDASTTLAACYPSRTRGEREREREREAYKEETEREAEKECRENIDTPPKRSRPSTTKLSDEDWMQSIKTNTAYVHVNVDVEYGKMMAWCATKNKEPTRARFLNWLNRIDRPMNVVPITKSQIPDGYASPGAMRSLRIAEELRRQQAEGVACEV